MAIQSLSYLSIPPAKRREAAARAIFKIKENLSDPTITPDQSKKMIERMSHLEKWVAGTLPASTPLLEGD